MPAHAALRSTRAAACPTPSVLRPPALSLCVHAASLATQPCFLVLLQTTCASASDTTVVRRWLVCWRGGIAGGGGARGGTIGHVKGVDGAGSAGQMRGHETMRTAGVGDKTQGTAEWKRNAQRRAAAAAAAAALGARGLGTSRSRLLALSAVAAAAVAPVLLLLGFIHISRQQPQQGQRQQRGQRAQRDEQGQVVEVLSCTVEGGKGERRPCVRRP